MVIETERLILRPFLESDAADVYEYLKAPAVNCFADMKLNSLEEACEEMKKRTHKTEYYLAITLKETGKVIGEIEAYPESKGPGSESPDTFSPNWMLNEKYQGHGYAFEAAHAFLDYLFREKGARSSIPIRRIITSPASICAKSLGCAGRACSLNSSPS